MPTALFALEARHRDTIYGPSQRELIAQHFDLLDGLVSRQTADEPGSIDLLRKAEVLFGGWGAPLMDQQFLQNTPRLKAVFYGAGSIRHIVTPAFWELGIPITSSYGGNAVPVAEFTFAQIILSLKRMWQHTQAVAAGSWQRLPMPGAYGSKVGIISLGMIGRRVCRLLQNLEVKVLAYDPFAAEEVFFQCRAEKASLEEVFASCDVVSLHAPWLPETEGMVNRSLFERMPDNGSFINTARGALVNERDLVEVFSARPDLTALLDVTHPEPPDESSPLHSLPNVILTPHIAGSVDKECERLGQIAVDEALRWLQGEPLQWQISRDAADKLA